MFVVCRESGNPLEHLEGFLAVVKEILKDEKERQSVAEH